MFPEVGLRLLILLSPLHTHLGFLNCREMTNLKIDTAIQILWEELLVRLYIRSIAPVGNQIKVIEPTITAL